MKTIYLVEDDPFIRDIVSTRLIDNGYHVVTAGSCDEAYEKLEEALPDLMLLDIDLPGGKTGLLMLTEMRTSDTYKNLKVIIFSNNDAPDIREQALAAGAQDFYFKAATGADELLAKIEEVISK